MKNPDNNTLVCVIIVSYNFEPWIHKCIPSVQSSTLSVTVLVIDNNSADSTCETIKSEYPDVVLIENKQNLGFGKANNIGIKYAIEKGFEYVFLLNQDAWIEKDTLERLVIAAKSNRCYAIISPVHLNGRGSSADYGFSDYTGIKNREEALHLPSEIVEYSFINAAMWLIPVSILKDAGGFAPIFTHYGEDRNFVLRVQKLGYKIGIVRSAFGYHDREARTLSRTQYFYSEYVYFLTEAVNPTYSYFKAFAYSLLAALKKAVLALFSGKYADFKEYISIIFRLIGKSSAICRTRNNKGTEIMK